MNKPFLDTLPPWPWMIRKNEYDVHDYENGLDYSILCADDYAISESDDSNVALIQSLAPELLEALQYCECELSMYRVLAEQSENPQAWYDAIAKARTVLKKLKGNIEDEQPTLF